MYSHSIHLQIFFIFYIFLTYVWELALNKIILPHLHNILPYLWLYYKNLLYLYKEALTFLQRIVVLEKREKEIKLQLCLTTLKHKLIKRNVAACTMKCYLFYTLQFFYLTIGFLLKATMAFLNVRQKNIASRFQIARLDLK